MKKYILYIYISAISIICLSAQDHKNSWTSGRPDGHAPISIMGDHTHGKGEFMVSYRYMRMGMEGMRDGTTSLDNSEVLSSDDYNYRVSPLEMPMDMHMLGAMYAISDHLTLMAMVNILDISMDHETRMGGMFTTEASGLGDIRVSALIKFFDNNRQRMHFNLRLSIPTGSIEEMDVTPASAPNETQLPYPMQLGSGSFDLLPGITYLGQAGMLSWGAQIMGNIRLGENNQDYRWGHQINPSIWGAVKFADWVSASLHAKGQFMGEIKGADPAYMMARNMRMVPTVFPENFGGSQIFSGIGVNLYVPSGTLKDIRLGAALEIPVLRDINGPQLETDCVFTLGVQYAF